MIGAFLESWELFQATWIAGLAIGGLLSLVGIWVVANQQIFLGMAVSQASTLGISVALFAGGAGLSAVPAEGLATGLAVVCAIGTALLTGFTERGRGESPEAVTGFVFLLAASVPVLLLSGSPHGLEEIHQLTFSTLLGASERDAARLVVVAVATAALAAALHPRLFLLALDPEMALAAGLRRSRWIAGVACWLGLCVGLSMRVSGMLFTFGCLVLPALIGRNLVREMRPLLILVPAIALAGVLSGLVLAHGLDTPPAHSSVALLCVGLLATWGVRRLRA